jgi:hypothetical protein
MTRNGCSFGADVGFRSFDQIIQTTLRRVWQSAALLGSHPNSETDALTFHLWALLDPLVSSVGIDKLLFSVEKVCCWGEVMHVGGG